MANSKTVREFAAGKGLAKSATRGRLSHAAIDAWNEDNPSDTYDGSEFAGQASTYKPKRVSVKTFKSGTNKNGKTYRVPVTKTVNLGEVRAWAKDSGKDMGARGRVSADLLAEFATTV